jgi:hypothetical protein
LFNKLLANSLIGNRAGIRRAVVSLFINLPFQNILTKFKNKVHLLVYILIFETLTGQRPVIQTAMSKVVSAKNKRERRKAQDGVRIEGYTLSASLYNSEHLQTLLYIFLYFIAPNTNQKKTAPSRFVPITLETTHQVIKFSLKSLGNLPFGFVADDLSALKTVLEIQIHPFSNSSNINHGDYYYGIGDRKLLIKSFRTLRFVASALGVTDIMVPSSFLDPVINLRLRASNIN